MMTKFGQEAFMFHYRHKLKTIKKFYRKISQTFLDVIKKKIIQFLRALLVNQKKQRTSVNAGFVLPTVAMVALVMVLMTTAILFRSFERAKHASNVRVNEAVLNAANPAIERAKAKIEQLFEDSRLESSIPSDFSLEQIINNNLNQFTFGDETQLKLVKDKETLQTVWKYPVDTDNNGKFDSYTLYGIYFRTPASNKARSVLQARTQPMDTGTVGTECQSLATNSGNLVSTYGWYKVGEKLKKSIFVYTTTVPITDLTGLNTNKYETFRGNKGFVALEYQQDRERIPLSNNAVVYEDDLEIAPEEGINLNGRILTNGNLLTTKLSNPIKFYLVSSPKSCYLKEGSNKIIVVGNVIDSRGTDNSSHDDVLVDLFNQQDANNTIKSDVINNTNKTVPTSVYGNTAAYNDEAYAKRIARLVQATNSAFPNNAELPEEVKQKIERDLQKDRTLEPAKVRNNKLKFYFKQRTRRVPYAEIPQGSNPLKYGSHDYETNSPIQGNGNSLRPVNEWVFPFNPVDGKTATNYAEIGIKDNGSKLYLPATEPVEQVKSEKEQNIGDRLLVGNNLPQLWYDTTKGKFLSSPDEGQIITGKEWDVDRKGNNSTVTRKRFSQAYQFEDLGATNRDEFWEKSAAQKPESSLDVVGGLRVVTGAGIYLSSRYTAGGGSAQFANAIADPKPDTIADPPDTMPDEKTPYLRMRATVVYHYQDDSYNPKTPTDYQKPIACISSYYNPTNSTTARNQKGFPDVSLRNTNRNLTGLPKVSNNPGDSNNGVVYSAESLSIKGYENVLNYQAKLKYPNEPPVNKPLRLVNKPLQKALDNISASKPLTLAEQSAVDSAICALKILDGTIGNPIDAVIPHGAIMETAFLDARQIKAIDKPESTPGSYDLDIKLRQPLEIRATILDLDLLRRKSKSGGEFLFPNSGIIYATRDDALPDASASKSPDEDDSENEDISATDFNLDFTRRPNSIMLINGSDLSRYTTYKAEEKGLILISNLPVYIKGNFNVHTQEEFTDNSLKGEKDWSNKFYARQSLNLNFGCRKEQFPGCNIGETWRSAVVIADAITVLSNNFRFRFREDSDYNSMQTATNTETNLIFAQGNTPGRPTGSNGGLENFVRYLENWKGVSHTVAGSFIQFKHSHYATAPWQTIIDGSSTSNQNLNRSPFFIPPNRFWSYDTALLSQSPDLFSVHFTTPATNKPNEFYREVGRDDAWVKTLLCAQEINGSYAISQDQHGTCP